MERFGQPHSSWRTSQDRLGKELTNKVNNGAQPKTEELQPIGVQLDL